jgi:ankyrin repeat protein
MSPLMIVVGVVLLGLAVAELFPFGNSELYRAMWDGDEARALELIHSGADPNSTWGAPHRIETENPAVRLSPLHFALARAQPGVALALIEAGADPNGRGDGGHTALMVAADRNWPEVVRALLAKGADPNAAGRHGATPPHYDAPFGFSGCRSEPRVRVCRDSANRSPGRGRPGGSIASTCPAPKRLRWAG